MKPNTLSHTHNSYQDLRIWWRHEIVRVMSTTVRSDIEEPLDKWVPRPALLSTRCSHSGQWSVILQMDVVDQGIRDDFFFIILIEYKIKYNKFSYLCIGRWGKGPRSHWLKWRWKRYCYSGNLNVQPCTLETYLIWNSKVLMENHSNLPASAIEGR
jgi:hypothetical protein